jgi:hypothetical protein
MAKYRKKPVVIEAVQFTDSGIANALGGWDAIYQAGGDERGPFLRFKTLEGVMEARLGDWIIKGIKGEFYPCKPDIFAATYEPAE